MVARSVGNTKNTPNYTGLQVQTSALGLPIAILWGRNRFTFNVIWWNDFRKREQSGKGKGGGKATNYTYSVALELALGWGVITSIPTVYLNQSKVLLADIALTLITGTAGQAPFPYIVSSHPDQALSYPNIAILAASNFQLGNSPILPAMSFEYVGRLSGSTVGTPDVNPEDFIPELLTDPLFGMGLTAGNIGASISFYGTYCQAQGLFMSPALVTQEKVTSVINRWATLTNSWIFWAGNEIKFVPLGTEVVVGNGTTYTPETTIRYNLGIQDFLDNDGPVKVQRIDPADAINTIRVEISDRARDYNSNPIEYKNQTLNDLYGTRDESVTAKEITEASIGMIIATLIGKRKSYLRNLYSWRSPHRFIALEPGDLVTLTDPTNEAITLLPVRVKTVDCDEDGSLSFTAEDYNGDLGTFTDRDQQAGTVIDFDKFVDPGDVNPPMVLEPRSDLIGSPIAQIMIAASGGANWGGCTVWISIDDVTYGRIGEITSPAPQGELTSNFPTHASGLDTTNTLQIDLEQSDVQLSAAVTHDDADNYRPLSYLTTFPVAQVISNVGELVAYGEVVPTSAFTNDIDYVYRGLYGTSPALHSTGDQFTSIDLSGTVGSLLSYHLPPQYIGSTIYLKFTSFNLYDLNEQEIADVMAYQFTTSGTGYGGGAGGVPTTPTGLAVIVGVDQNSTSWNSNPSTDNVTSYRLYRAPGTGALFGSAGVIWTGFATNNADVNITSGAGYTYFLTAVNVVGESLPTAGVNATSSVFTRPLRVSAGTPGRKPLDEEVIFTIPMKTGDALPANLAGSELQIDTNNGGIAPTLTWIVTIKKNNTTIFTGTIAAAGVIGSFSAGSAVTFVDGDFLSATCITPQDSAAEGISLTLVGTRTQ